MGVGANEYRGVSSGRLRCEIVTSRERTGHIHVARKYEVSVPVLDTANYFLRQKATRESLSTGTE